MSETFKAWRYVRHTIPHQCPHPSTHGHMTLGSRGRSHVACRCQLEAVPAVPELCGAEGPNVSRCCACSVPSSLNVPHPSRALSGSTSPFTTRRTAATPRRPRSVLHRLRHAQPTCLSKATVTLLIPVVRVMQLLLAAGADPSVRDNFGMTPRETAANKKAPFAPTAVRYSRLPPCCLCDVCVAPSSHRSTPHG